MKKKISDELIDEYRIGLTEEWKPEELSPDATLDENIEYDIKSMFEEDMVAELLQNNILFISGCKESLTLFVGCNDLFAWESVDGEDIKYSEVEELYKIWRRDKVWGVEKWCCKKRNQRPQIPVEKKMREDKVWDDVMEGLPLNTKGTREKDPEI